MLPRVLAYINTRITPDDLSARSRSETTQIHDRFGRLQGNYGRALRPVPRGAGGRQPRMADPPVHGEGNPTATKRTALGTHKTLAPSRPAIGCVGTQSESDAA